MSNRFTIRQRKQSIRREWRSPDGYEGVETEDDLEVAFDGSDGRSRWRGLFLAIRTVAYVLWWLGLGAALLAPSI